MRVQRVLDGAVHGQHLVAQLLLQPGPLQQSYAVLASDRATQVQRVINDLRERQLRPFAGRVIAGLGDDQRVQVAVAGVGDVGDMRAVTQRGSLDPAQHLRQRRDGDADVFGEQRTEALQRG